MIRFRQTFGAHAGRVLRFEKDRVRFGRMPDSDFPFDPHADLDASGRHAEARFEAGQWLLVDMGSRNGTWVNGSRVKSIVLSAGDQIEFGHGGPRVLVEAIEVADAPAGAAIGQSAPASPRQEAPEGIGNAPTLLAAEGAVPPTVPPPRRTPASSPPGPGAAPQSAAPESDSSEPKVYGDATAGRMVHDAVAEALARQRAEANARRVKLALGCVVLGLALVLGGLVVLFVALRA